MRIVLSLLISCILAASSMGDYQAIPRNSDVIRVAVYDNGPDFNKYGINYIYEALKNAPGIKAEIIDNLAGDTLKKYDTVVISTVTSLAKKDIMDSDRGIIGTDWIRTLTNYVDCGGGLVLGHNAIGFKGIFSTYKLFPMMGTSNGKNLESGYTVKNQSHPVMMNIPDNFFHNYDHMEITPGKDAQILAVDKRDRAVIVAGDVSRGRIVQIGFPLGLYWKDQTGPLPAVDQNLLMNAVKWAGDRPKYDIPQIDTETGLMAESQKYNDQLKYAEIVKYRTLPQPQFDDAMIWMPTYWLVIGDNPAGLDNPDRISKVMDNCKRMGFNKVGIVAKGGVYFYPTALSQIEEKRACRDDFSPVGCMVDEARKRNMKVSLMIFPFKSNLEWDKYTAEINKSEYEKIQQGKMSISDVGANCKWNRSNCPDHPDVRTRALRITEELICKYHPDELYLDFIRYKDGYETSCYCDYSLKQKAEFAAKHPEIPQDKLNEKFAEESLISFVEEWIKLCNKLDPNIKTACYTISAPDCKAPAWVNRYAVDLHGKYVSRHTSGPESSLNDVSSLTKFYSKWATLANPFCQFSPIIAAYEPKSAERILTEFKIVSDFQCKARVKCRRVEFFDYSLLIKDKKLLTLDDEMARGISQSLGGTWDKK